MLTICASIYLCFLNGFYHLSKTKSVLFLSVVALWLVTKRLNNYTMLSSLCSSVALYIGW